MEKEFLDMLKRHSIEEESVLWYGKSDISKLFSWKDIFFIPFSIIFGIGSLIWELSSIAVMTGSMKAKDATPSMGGVFAFVGLIFVFLAYYFMVGRFIEKRHDKEKTLYVVTDKRVLVLKNEKHEKVIIKSINEISDIDIDTNKSGMGTITFGKVHPNNKLYGNTGIESPWSFIVEEVPIFYDIHDARKVYELVGNLRNER